MADTLNLFQQQQLLDMQNVLDYHYSNFERVQRVQDLEILDSNTDRSACTDHFRIYFRYIPERHIRRAKPMIHNLWTNGSRPINWLRALTPLQSHSYPSGDDEDKEHIPWLLQTPAVHKPPFDVFSQHNLYSMQLHIKNFIESLNFKHMPSQSLPKYPGSQSQLIPDATTGLSLLLGTNDYENIIWIILYDQFAIILWPRKWPHKGWFIKYEYIFRWHSSIVARPIATVRTYWFIWTCITSYKMISKMVSLFETHLSSNQTLRYGKRCLKVYEIDLRSRNWYQMSQEGINTYRLST